MRSTTFNSRIDRGSSLPTEINNYLSEESYEATFASNPIRYNYLSPVE